MFVRNAWYVAAWDHEVTRDHEAPHPPRRAGGAVPQGRRHAGRAGRPLLPPPGAAVDGQAGRQHRRNARITACSSIPTGKCVKVPSQDLVPNNARVRAYPVVEKNHWIWIWMGDPAKADPALIEDFHWLDDPALALRRQLPARRGELPAAGREPARHHPPALPASEHARHRRLRALRVRGDARGRPRHGDALADERAAGAVPQADGRASRTA